MKDILECYKILGLKPGASPERVRNAYVQLSRFYDPNRYVGEEPEHLANAEQKRKEVEEAYQEIRRFLPALQRPSEPIAPVGVQNRDFMEMTGPGPRNVSNTLVTIVLGTAVVLILGWGFCVYRQSRDPSSGPGPVGHVE